MPANLLPQTEEAAHAGARAASGELFGLACGLTVCYFQKGGAPSSETTEP
jgi:hypothetical protein